MTIREKCTFVHAYVRWRFGRLERVCAHRRSGPWCQLVMQF